jgi:branched-chain amino acid transport system substrate-binding protein
MKLAGGMIKASPHRIVRRVSQHRAVLGFALAATLLSACGTRISDDRLSAANAGSLQTGSIVDGGTAGGGALSSSTGGTGGTGGSTGTSGIVGPAGTTGGLSGSGSTSGGGATGTTSAVGTTTGGSTGSTSGTVSPSASCSKQLAPVNIGQDGAFSGFLQESLGGFRPGLAAWAADVNARGGVQCHPVRLFQQDDQSNPSKTVSNTQDLIQNKHVAVMVGAAVPFNVASYRSVVDPAGMPTIGGDNIAADWDTDQMLFPTGVTTLPGMAGAMKASAARTGLKRFAVVYCVEAQTCTLVHQQAENLAKLAGVQIVNQQSISLTQTDYTSTCQNAKNAGAQSILAVFDASALNRFFRSCASIGYHPPSATIGLAVSAASAADPNVRAATVTVTATMAPYFDSFIPGVAAFQAAMKKYAPGVTIDNSSMAAYAAGRLLEAALAAVSSEARSGPITTALVLKGLHALKNETLAGLAATPLNYRAGQPNGLKPCSFPTVVGSQGISDPTHGRAGCV